MTEKKAQNNKIKLSGDAPFIIIMGDGGAGKTRLAAKGGGFCLNTEGDGAATAYPPGMVYSMQYGDMMWDGLVQSISIIANTAKKDKNLYSFKVGNETIKAPYIVVDTVDTGQQVLVDRLLSQKRRPSWATGKIWGPKMEQQDWGTLLSIMQPIITEARRSGVPFVWVTHAKVKEPEYKWQNGANVCVKTGTIETALQGSFRQRLFNQATVVVHMTAEENGMRYIYTQPAQYGDVKYECKDRHSIFRSDEGKILSKIPIPGDKDGYPTRDVVTWILEKFDY